MNMKQFKLTFLLTVLMSMVGLRVIAYDAVVDGIYYNFSGTEATVTHGDVKYTGNVVIPSSVTYDKTYNVTSIGYEAFFGCTDLTSIDISNGVTTIVSRAFVGCTGLTSITIGNNVTSIGSKAFWCCTGLTSITIGNSVTSIGEMAFDNCSGLTSVTIGNSVESIGNSAFADCTDLTSITIPSSVTSIGGAAFASCTNLTSVTFDNCTPSFYNSYVFNNSNKLKDIYYPAYAHSYYKDALPIDYIYVTTHPQIKIDREWTTYCATARIDVPEGIDAYVVKSCSEGVVTLQKVTTINAGQGVLLKPASVGKFYNVHLWASDPEAYESNMLKGVTTAIAIGATDGEYTNFIFTDEGGEIGFDPVSTGEVPAYNAYLQIPTASLYGVPSRQTIVMESQCATPTISYKDGILTFDCDTEGVTFVYSFNSSSADNVEGNNVVLPSTFTVSVYAKKDGYLNSDIATQEIDVCGIKGDVDGDGVVDVNDVQTTINIILKK